MTLLILILLKKKNNLPREQSLESNGKIFLPARDSYKGPHAEGNSEVVPRWKVRIASIQYQWGRGEKNQGHKILGFFPSQE